MKQGNRTDLSGLKDEVDKSTDLELWESNFHLMVKYHKAVSVYRDLKRSGTRNPPEVHILFGFAGTGKTKAAYDYDQDLFSYMGGQWFDGYTGQNTALFDEFDGSEMSFALWKKVCDRYPLRVTVKGASVNWSPDRIYFTSNFHPRNWFSKEKHSAGWWQQFSRRVTVCKEYFQDGSIIELDLNTLDF